MRWSDHRGHTNSHARLAPGTLAALLPLLALLPVGAEEPRSPSQPSAQSSCGRAASTDAPQPGSRLLSRDEAALLWWRCLETPGSAADALRPLAADLDAQRGQQAGRAAALGQRLEALEAQAFSPTTKLSGQATFVLGANAFGGSASDERQEFRDAYGATVFNYDLQLNLDTSFSGTDLLRVTLRAGNFDVDSNSFFGAGPSSLSTLEVAFQEDSGPDRLGIDRLFWQGPLGGGFTATLGGRVGQDDMVAFWPGVYPEETVLDVFTLNGAPAAYNKAVGPGAGLWWQRGGFSISASTVAANGGAGDPASGGIFTSGAGSTTTLQIGFQRPQWAVAAIAAAIQNGNELIVYGTYFALNSFSTSGTTTAFGLSGFWQPAQAGWLPSISAGWGLNSSVYDQGPEGGDAARLVTTSQSWSVGLQWLDLFGAGHAVGLAVGQPTFATRLADGSAPADGNLAWESWFRYRLSDQISLTPALFYLSRPLGADTPSGRSLDQLGGLLKLSFRF